MAQDDPVEGLHRTLYSVKLKENTFQVMLAKRSEAATKRGMDTQADSGGQALDKVLNA